MPKYLVRVKVIASNSYEVEVEASGERNAEEQAIDLWRTKTSPDFQVADIDEAQAEAEQLTWQCNECDREITYEEWAKGDTLCAVCAAKETNR
jgi:formylmethanofuran dehydrogenase subunit E